MIDLPTFEDPATAAAATYLAATLHALVREEHAGRRPRRLLEPSLATWQRFRGRLGARDLAELILEDAAVTQPEPFKARDILHVEHAEQPFHLVPEALVERWLAELPGTPAGVALGEDLEQQAQRLGLVARPAFSDLPKLQPHHRVLELPGSGGRLAAHIAETQPDISFKDIFTIACASWQERTLAGLVAVGLGVVGDVRIVVDPALAECKGMSASFTHIIGLRPDKGGRFNEHEIEGLFPSTTIVLV